ncbi:MAG: glycosyl hydrolase-related protein [Terriglobales bacterium]
MRPKIFILPLFCALLAMGARAQQKSRDSREVYVVPFSHLDLYWACTQEECLDRGNYIISRAIQLAKQNPQFRYLLETEVFVANFTDSHRGTKELEDFKQLVKEGRIEIAPLWAAIYQNQTRDEALVRNVVYGKRYARDVFGVDTKVAHLADIPGFTRQFPQILSKAQVPYMVMTRMGPRDRSLFRWRAPDSSSVLVWNTINGYGWGVGLGLHLDLDKDRLAGVTSDVKAVEATTNGPVYMGWGTDLYAPNNKLIENMAVLNRNLFPIRFRLSTAEEFFEEATRTSNIPDLSGEIPSSWANLTTSLVPLWLPALSATNTLVTAEKFAAINYALGYADYPDKAFEHLWKDNLKSLDHNNDGQGGKIGDERKLGYADAASLGAGQILRDSLRNIAERVRSPYSKSISLVVFNPLSWMRDGVVQAHATLFGEVETSDIDGYKKGMKILDEKGRSIPFEVEQYTDGSSRSLDLTFTASDVPSLGYKTYYLAPTEHPETFPKAFDIKLDTDDTARQANDTVGSDMVESEFYRVSIDRATGRIDIFDKDLNQFVSKGIEISGFEERGGDDQNIILPTGRTIVNVVDSVELIESNSSRAVVSVRGSLAGVPIDQRITLYRALKKIDIENTISWQPGQSINIEQIFPVLQPDFEVRNGIPFGTVASTDMMPGAGPHGDDEVTPEIWKHWRQIQDWVFAGARDWGFTVSADHNLIEVDNSAVKFDMLRGTRFSPATTVRNGQPILDARPPVGIYTFRYSFTSGKDDWSAAKSWRAGMAFASPLIAVTSVNNLSEKPLPSEKSFLSFQADNLVLTALKKSDRDATLTLRAFEIQGRATQSSILFLGRETKFRRANLLEEDVSAGEEKTLHAQPFEIETVKLPIP